MIFKKQNKISVEVTCKACSGVGKIDRPKDFKTSGGVDLEMCLKYCQGICLACNGLGFQIVEKFVEEK